MCQSERVQRDHTPLAPATPLTCSCLLSLSLAEHPRFRTPAPSAAYVANTVSYHADFIDHSRFKWSAIGRLRSSDNHTTQEVLNLISAPSLRKVVPDFLVGLSRGAIRIAPSALEQAIGDDVNVYIYQRSVKVSYELSQG